MLLKMVSAFWSELRYWLYHVKFYIVLEDNILHLNGFILVFPKISYK